MIIFLGAGISKLFGIPDMKGFFEIFDREPQITQFKIYQEIKNSFADDVDLEVLMTILEDLSKERSAILKNISPQTTDFLFKNIKHGEHYLDDKEVKIQSTALKENVKKIIEIECLKAENKNQDKIMDVYDRFLQTLANLNLPITSRKNQSGDGKVLYPSDLRIFTTNYDRCLETYLSNREIKFTQGLDHRFRDVVFDVSKFDDSESKVGLFKLHGSIELFNINGMLRLKRYGEESEGEAVVYYPIEFSGYQHVIESPYLELFYLFRDRLNKDNTWIIVGSSLRDRTICSIMNDVIRLKPEGQQPTIIFVNPDETVVDRLKNWGFLHLSEKISLVKEYFGSDETNKAISSKFSSGYTVSLGLRR